MVIRMVCLFMIMFCSVATSVVNGQNRVCLMLSGRVVDAVSGAPISGCRVYIDARYEQGEVTDADGCFVVDSLTAGSHKLKFVCKNYLLIDTLITFTTDRHLERIALHQRLTTRVKTREIVEPKEPDIGYYIADYESENIYLEPLSGSSDPVRSLINYGFSHISYNHRGDIFRNADIRFDQVSLSDPFRRGAAWGVATAAGNRVVAEASGTATPDVGFGSTGGYKHFSSDPAPWSSRFRAQYTLGNHRYVNRVKLGVNDLAITEYSPISYSLNADVRWGRDLFFDGVYQRRGSLSARVTLPIGYDHKLTLWTSYDDSEQGLKTATTDEVYALVATGDHPHPRGYNSSVGLQNDKVRNSSVLASTMTAVTLKHLYTPKSNGPMRFTLTTAVALIRDCGGRSAFARFDAENPYPDYYAYLPSNYDDPLVVENLKEEWRIDPQVRKVNWNKLHQVNFNNIIDNKIRSKYILERRMDDRSLLRFSSVAAFVWESKGAVSVGLDVALDSKRSYKIVDDLLGGDYWVDIDTYLIDDLYYGDMTQNDVRNPNRHVVGGDRFGYDYELSNVEFSPWMTAYRNVGRFRLEAAVKTSSRSIFRRGYYEKEMFQGAESYGKSATHRFNDVEVKAAARYTPNHGLHFSLECMTGTEMPTAAEIFLSPQYRNVALEETMNTKFNSVEVGFERRRYWGRLSLRAYATSREAITEIINRYDEVSKQYSHFVLRGHGAQTHGVEFGVDAQLFNHVEFAGFVSVGRYRYRKDPTVVQYMQKNGARVEADDSRVHIDGLKLPDAPELAAAASFTWSPVYGFRMNVTTSYTSQRVAAMDKVRRMDRLTMLTQRADVVDRIMEQTSLPAHLVTDLMISKRFDISGSHSLFVMVAANNVTNTQIVRSGYEQYRLRRVNAPKENYYDPYGIKYSNDYGRTYSITVSYQF